MRPIDGDRNGFELRARGPAADEAAAVQVDEHALAVGGSDAVLRRVVVSVHAADRDVLALDREELVLALEIARRGAPGCRLS